MQDITWFKLADRLSYFVNKFSFHGLGCGGSGHTVQHSTHRLCLYLISWFGRVRTRSFTIYGEPRHDCCARLFLLSSIRKQFSVFFFFIFFSLVCCCGCCCSLLVCIKCFWKKKLKKKSLRRTAWKRLTKMVLDQEETWSSLFFAYEQLKSQQTDQPAEEIPYRMLWQFAVRYWTRMSEFVHC